MNRKLVIGIRPGEHEDDALQLGRLLAEVLSARPIVFTALPWPAYLAGPEELQKQAEAEMEWKFAVISDELRHLDAETMVTTSQSPAESLEAIADAEDADLIVIGSASRGPIGRTLLGSVSGSVVTGSSHAVAIAPHGYAEQTSRRLLEFAVAFDGSPEAWAALETGVGLAERCHGSLTVIAVADYPYYGYATSWSVLTTGEIRDAEHTEKRRVLDLAMKRIPEGLGAESRLLTGSAGVLLSEVSGEFDLLIAGSRSYGPLRRTLLGSTTHKLAQSAGCPVLILPRAAGVDPLGVSTDRAHTGSSKRVAVRG